MRRLCPAAATSQQTPHDLQLPLPSALADANAWLSGALVREGDAAGERIVRNVHCPSITPFLPELYTPERPQPVVLLIPGGAHEALCWCLHTPENNLVFPTQHVRWILPRPAWVTQPVGRQQQQQQAAAAARVSRELPAVLCRDLEGTFVARWLIERGTRKHTHAHTLPRKHRHAHDQLMSSHPSERGVSWNSMQTYVTGVAAFVLKYRMARAEGSPYELEHCVLDTERAIRTRHYHSTLCSPCCLRSCLLL